MAHEEEGFTLRLAHIMPERPGLKIYVPRDQADGLRQEFDDAGYETQELAEFAFGVDDAILGIFLVAVPATARALAPVLTEYIKKNQHVRIHVKAGDMEVDVSGLSGEKTQDAVMELLAEVDQTQKSEDESWRAIQKETGGEDGSTGGEDDS